jgi:LacI family transcriptional regulator
MLVPTDISVEGGFLAAADIVGMPGRPTAALCYNDMVALGFIRGLEKQGIIAGWDFAIIGFDDIQQSASWRPSLSTLNTQPEKIGGEAARVLIRLINGQDGGPRRLLLPPELVLRESTGSLPKTD